MNKFEFSGLVTMLPVASVQGVLNIVYIFSFLNFYKVQVYCYTDYSNAYILLDSGGIIERHFSVDFETLMDMINRVSTWPRADN